MFNIFKTHKRNKELLSKNEALLEENKKLKAQNDALERFRTSFESYYYDISGVKTIVKENKETITLNGICTLDREFIHFPTEECKALIVEKISEQLMPFIEFDFVDNHAYGTKDIIGRLRVLKRI